MPANGNFSIELVGLDTYIGAMARWGERAPAGLKQVLLEEANLIFRKSQILAPYRHGTLRSSGRVEATESSIEISYGGAASAYAYIMHRGIMRGKPIHYHTPGTQANYLAEPVAEALVNLPERLITRLETILGT